MRRSIFTDMRNIRLAVLLAVTLGSLAAPPARGQSEINDAAERASEMVRYYFVFLRRGPVWTAEVTPESRAVSEGHMANIDRLAESGELVLAGPFLDQSGDNALAGLFVLRADSVEAAREIVETDPAVAAGRFVYEVVPWFGPRTLGQ